MHHYEGVLNKIVSIYLNCGIFFAAMKNFFKNSILLSASLVISIVILELTIAVSGVSATAVRTRPVDLTSPYIHAVPNHEYVYALGAFGEILQHHKTNNYGFKTEVQFSKYSKSKKSLFIGGSLVMAVQVAPSESAGSILNKKTDYDVYPISTSRPTLSQHLAYAQFGMNEFIPEKIIFLITSTNFKQSLLSNDRSVGKFYFDDENDYVLHLVDYNPGLLKEIFSHSYLLNYIYKNLSIKGLFDRFGEGLFNKNSQQKNVLFSSAMAITDQDAMAKTTFFSGLDKLEINPENILFVFVEDRPMVYSNEARGSDHPFVEFAKQALKKNYQVLDLHEHFRSHYQVNKQRFEFETDGHWNATANQIVADAIMQYGFLN